MKQNKRKQGPKEYYTITDLQRSFGITKGMVERYFPGPALRKNFSGRYPVRLWSQAQVREALRNPGLAETLQKAKKMAEQNRLDDRIRQYLSAFDAERLRSYACGLERRFVLHVGPTNSGKTYQAIQALKDAARGVYLGPLRLLALEMFDNLNQSGIPCDLLTGEESVRTEGASHTASTIELADTGKHYDVAVIDEAQMITDPFRGDQWVHAIYCIDAEEVHICLAPEARELILRILAGFGAPCEIVEHHRLAPLSFAGTFGSLKETRPGDALIVFSRKAVLAVAAELEERHIHASVIYGALPPVSRKEEVRKFAEGETSVVVATDAIGMGISLPIRRVIFCETSKFDGKSRRKLTSGEIKQVAGRAGRYGIFDRGEVLSMQDEPEVMAALFSEEKQVSHLMIPFPMEAVKTEYPLDRLMILWNRLPAAEGFSRVDMSDPLILYQNIRPLLKKVDRELLFQLMTCPVDTGNEELIQYWVMCSHSILTKRPLPEPFSGFGTLQECETRYKELDIRHQLLRRIGVEEDRMAEKAELCETINRFLKENKDAYLRACTRCGRKLPATGTYGICDRCYREQFRFPSGYRK